MATLTRERRSSVSSYTPERSGLNQAQIHLLQLVSHIQTDDTLKELKRLIRNHYAQESQKYADKYWADGAINDDIVNEHLRTEYK